MRTPSSWIVLLVALSPVLAAQQVRELTLPSTAATRAGTHSDYVPWRPNPAGNGWRVQSCYERDNLLDQGVFQPVDIRRLRLRAALVGAAATCRVSVSMSTASVAASALTSAYRLNHGSDLTTVFSGYVQVAAVPTASAPGPYFVDLQLTAPFRYDPFAGDLLVDFRLLNSDIAGGPAAATEYMGFGAGRGRLVAGDILSQNASIQFDGTMVLRVDYTVPGGFAEATPYGRGCPDQAISVHESFDPVARPFDLSGTTAAPRRLRFAAVPGGYLVGQRLPGAWHTPTSADLALGDDQCSPPQALPFAFPFVQRDGSVASQSQVVVSSNGFVWLDPARTEADFTPTVAELLGQSPRIAALWTDLAPNLGGSIRFDVDPAVPAAYVTWLAVPEYSRSGPVGANTVQLALFADGSFELRWAECSTAIPAALVGWSPGGGALDLGPNDLSAVADSRIGRDALPLRLQSVDRPVLGATFHPWLGEIPVGTAFGALCLGFDDVPIDLSPIGMNGCTRWSGWDVVQMLQLAGVSSAVAALPLPPDPRLVGVVFYGQAVTFSPGFNPLGVVASNGLRIRLDAN